MQRLKKASTSLHLSVKAPDHPKSASIPKANGVITLADTCKSTHPELHQKRMIKLDVRDKKECGFYRLEINFSEYFLPIVPVAYPTRSNWLLINSHAGEIGNPLHWVKLAGG